MGIIFEKENKKVAKFKSYLNNYDFELLHHIFVFLPYSILALYFKLTNRIR